MTDFYIQGMLIVNNSLEVWTLGEGLNIGQKQARK